MIDKLETLLSRRHLFWVLLGLWLAMLVAAAGVHTESQLILRVGLMILLAGLFLAHRQGPLPLPLLRLTLLTLGLLVLQCLPIGAGLLNILSPFRWQLLQEAQRFVPEISSSVSLLPMQSLEVLLQVLTYFLFFWTASWIFENEDHRYSFGKIVILIASGFALLGLLQRVIDVDWLPHLLSGDRRGFATFINPNQAAIFLVLIMPFSLTGFLLARGKKPRLFFATNFLIQFLSCIFSMSRFAIVGASVAVFVSLVYYFVLCQRHRLKGGRRSLILALMLMGVALFYVFYIMGTHDLQREVQRLHWSQLFKGYRLDLWQDSIQAAKQSPLFGYGAGNFSTVVPMFRSYRGYLWAEHAESEYLEVLLTMGMLGLALLLFFIYVVFRRIVQVGSRLDWVHAGCVSACVCATLAISVHFIFEVPALMLLLAMILGMLFPLQEARVVLEPRSLRRWLIVSSFVLLYVVALFHNARAVWKSDSCLQQTTDMAATAYGSEAEQQAAAISALESTSACIAKRPYDYRFYKDYGWQLLRGNLRQEDPITYLRMATRLNPFDPGNHFGLAQAFTRNGEYRLAIKHLKQSIALSDEIQPQALKSIYFQMAQLHMRLGETDAAATNLQLFVGLGGNAAEADFVQLQQSLQRNDFRQAIIWGERIVASDARYLERAVKALLEFSAASVLEKRAAINQLLLASHDLANAMQRVMAIIAPARLQEIWGERLFVFLPGRLPDDYGTTLQRLESKTDQPITQQSRLDAASLQWVYSLDATYAAQRDYFDYWGVATEIAVVDPRGFANLRVEQRVKLPYKPVKQLQIIVRSAQNEMRIFNQQSLPSNQKDGWYTLVATMSELANLPALNDDAYKITQIGFNTAMVSGRYQLGELRIYLSNN